MADFDRTRVLRLDRRSRSVRAIVGLALPRAVVTGDREFLPSHIATGTGAVWASTARGYVARIDPTTDRVTAYVKPTPDATGDLAAGAGAVWVSEGVYLARIDPATGALERIELVGPDGVRMGVSTVAICRDVVRGDGELVRLMPDASGHRSFEFTGRAAVAEIDASSGEVRAVRHTSTPQPAPCSGG